MKIGIDASNLRDGGGITHLTELLRAADPARDDFSEIVLWGGGETLDRVEEQPWLRKDSPVELDASFRRRLAWQRFNLPAAARRAQCDLLFAPGGLQSGRFHPVVTMCRNMLPFSSTERARYGWSAMRARFLLLRFGQAKSFKRADGVIFLTQWAQLRIESYLRQHFRHARIIPHGISDRFRRPSQEQLPAAAFSTAQPFRWLYVSVVAPYKHQATMAEAVALLRERGEPMRLDFVGPAEIRSLDGLKKTIAQLDPAGEFLRYHGAASYAELHRHYHEAHGFVFASSCENMPNILLEAMSAGLPVASSNCGPMPEMLGDGGLFFDPADSVGVAEVLHRLYRDPALRRACVARAVARASVYSWERCARETFRFLRVFAEREKEAV